MKDNKILKLAFVLLVICAVTAGILGVVNALTAQRIYDMAHAKEFEAYAAVLESSSGYSELSFDKEAFPTVDSIMSSNDGNGYVVTSTFSGAQGEHSETSGLGAVAAASSAAGEAFRGQFIGQGSDIALSKAGGSIDALAGATITSNAVTGATATSIAAVESVKA